jgi:hypothetical protein
MKKGTLTRMTGIVCLILSFPLFISAAKNTDVVELKIGSVLIGEIMSLAQGHIKFKTDQMDTIQIWWNKVAHITRPRNFEIELSSGQKISILLL